MEERENMQQTQENAGTLEQPMPQGNAEMLEQSVLQENAGASSQGMPPQPGYGQGMPSQMNAGVPPQPGYGQGMPPQSGYGQGMPSQMNAGNGIPPQILPQMNPGYGMPAYGYPNRQQGVSDGLAIASMVLGIVSVLICIWFYVSLPCAILGLILGCVYRAKGGKSGMSVAGIACSSVAIALALLMIVLVVWDCMYLL